MPHSEFLSWESQDRDAVWALSGYNAERCPDCNVHPSVWRFDEGGHPNAVGAEWVYCRVCESIELARRAGPPQKDENGEPAPGWRLQLTLNTPDGGDADER